MSITDKFSYIELTAFFAGKRAAARDHWMLCAREQKSVILDLKSFYVSLARNCNHDMIRYIREMREYRDLDTKIKALAEPPVLTHSPQADALDESDVWLR